MRTIEIPSTGANVEELLRQAHEENLILRTADGREYVLAELDDFDREIELVRENEALMQLLAERSKSAGRYTVAQVRAKLGV